MSASATTVSNTTITSDNVPASTDATAPLVSSSPANQSTAAASSGTAAAIVILLLWVLGMAHVVVPAEVAAAFVTLIGAGVHYTVVKYGLQAAQ